MTALPDPLPSLPPSPQESSELWQYLPDVDALHAEVTAGIEQDEWSIYRHRQWIEACWKRLAVTQVKQGDPSLLLQLQEFQRQWPNLPPTQRVLVSTRWHSLYEKS